MENWLGQGYLVVLVEKGVGKKLRVWCEKDWMEMVQSRQIQRGFQYSGY